jgi:hypothetical protein
VVPDARLARDLAAIVDVLRQAIDRGELALAQEKTTFGALRIEVLAYDFGTVVDATCFRVSDVGIVRILLSNENSNAAANIEVAILLLIG